MQETKINRKKNPNNMITDKKSQIKTNQKQVNKSNGIIKFSRQQQSKMISNTSSMRTSVVVPDLNLIKIKVSKQQQALELDIKSQDDQQNPLNPLNKKYKLNRIETRQTKNPLTSNRQSYQHIYNQNKGQFHLSPTVSNRLLQSPLKSLLKSHRSKNSSSDFQSQADKQQLLLLQIKQLKRQNTFLKKKIRDFNKQLNGGYLPQEYQFQKIRSPSNNNNKKNPIDNKNKNIPTTSNKNNNKKGFQHLNIQSLHLSVNLFFQQIKNLLTSVTQLFRIQFTQQEIQHFKSLHQESQIIEQLNQQICPLRKHQILKKYFLKRKLDRLAFEEDDKRYETLLTIFTQYYRFKEESQRKVVDIIDSMTIYANDLNKWLIQKAYMKKMKSQVESQKSQKTTHKEMNKNEIKKQISPPKNDNLRVPQNIINHVNKVRKPTLSPATQKIKNNNQM